MSTRARLAWLALGAFVLAGTALTAAASNGFGFAAADAREPRRVPATAEIVREDLVATTDEQGRLAYSGEATLRGSGGIVTWLPSEGAVIERGGQLYRVDEVPTVLFYGSLPAYRALSAGSEGADVRQLEENLAALGYTGFTVDDEYTGATAQAVRKWQSDLGQEKTGVVELGRILYRSGPVQVTTLGLDVGEPAEGDLLTIAARERVITVDLDESDRRFAVVGAGVAVTLPDGAALTGTITAVTTVVVPGEDTPGGDAEDETVLRVTIAPDDPAALPPTGSSTATVSFTSDRRDGVLTVPVTALLALAEGGYAVEIVEDEKGDAAKEGAGAGTRLVAVETGLFADGRVEITGDGITEGQRVVIPG